VVARRDEDRLQRTVARQDGIFVVNVDGSGLRQIPTPAGTSSSPSFSPDGTTIAFDHADVSDVDSFTSEPSRIYLVAASGTGLRQLPGTGAASGPAWSPDGRRIAYVRERENTGNQIAVVNADGTGRAMLTPSESGNASSPAWSPDGSRIAFDMVTHQTSSLYVVTATGGRPARLTSRHGLDHDPTWQPAGPARPAPAPSPTLPPSQATADARAVGLLLETASRLALDDLSSPSAPELLRLSQRVHRVAQRVSLAARRLRPTTNAGRRVLRRIGDMADGMREMATSMRAWSRSVRRHRRGAAAEYRLDGQLSLIIIVAHELDAARQWVSSAHERRPTALDDDRPIGSGDDSPIGVARERLPARRSRRRGDDWRPAPNRPSAVAYGPFGDASRSSGAKRRTAAVAR
jgi:hypothetical protein